MVGQPISGSISFKQVSKVFSAQIEVSTTRNYLVHVPKLLDSGANSFFRNRGFAQVHLVSLRKLPCLATIVVIDGCPIAFGNIVEESESVHVVLDNLERVISLNIIISPEE